MTPVLITIGPVSYTSYIFDNLASVGIYYILVIIITSIDILKTSVIVIVTSARILPMR